MLKKYINNALPPLNEKDTLIKALGWMDEFKVMHLPVLSVKGELLGIISEEDIVDNDTVEGTIAEAHMHYQMLFVSSKAHVLDIIKTFAITNSSVVPVIDEHEQYVGCVSFESVMKEIGHISFFKDLGGIIALEMNEHDYSLTEIANIVESNGAKILGTYIKSHQDSTKITVTVKVNRNEISDVLQTFERYEYNVVGTFDAKEYEETQQDKFDQFMNFLNT